MLFQHNDGTVAVWLMDGVAILDDAAVSANPAPPGTSCLSSTCPIETANADGLAALR